MRPQAAAIEKKPYQKPQFLVYGDLTEMTQGAGMMKMMDSGIMGKTG